MPQIEAVYEELPEFIDLADKLISKFPEEFANIDIARIACVAITNKKRGDKKRNLWELRSIRPPISLFCQKEYIVVFYSHDWEEMNEKQHSLIAADVLCSIPPNGKGAIIPMDYKDHSKMLRTFGVDYIDIPENKMPDILKDNIDWKK